MTTTHNGDDQFSWRHQVRDGNRAFLQQGEEIANTNDHVKGGGGGMCHGCGYMDQELENTQILRDVCSTRPVVTHKP